MMGDSASADENLMLTCQFDCTNYDKWGTIKQFLELFRFEAMHAMTNEITSLFMHYWSGWEREVEVGMSGGKVGSQQG